MSDLKETKKVLAMIKLLGGRVSILLVGGILGYILGRIL